MMSKIKLEHAEAVGMADYFPRINALLEEVTIEVKAIAETVSPEIVANVWHELGELNTVLLKYYPELTSEAVKQMTDEEAEEVGRDVAIFTVLSRNFLAMQKAVGNALQQRKGGFNGKAN